MGRRGGNWISQLERLAAVLLMVAIALRLFVAALPYVVLPAIVFVCTFVVVRLAIFRSQRW